MSSSYYDYTGKEIGTIDNDVQDGPYILRTVTGRFKTKPNFQEIPNTSDCVSRHVTPPSYDELAAKTDGDNDFYLDIRRRLNLLPEREWIKLCRLLHAGIGMATETGEFLDVIKKYLIYGKPIDETNLREEIGDNQWYEALGAKALGTNLDACQRTNIAKLKARYGDKFSQDAAVNRNLDKERQVLEDSEGTSK